MCARVHACGCLCVCVCVVSACVCVCVCMCVCVVCVCVCVCVHVVVFSSLLSLHKNKSGYQHSSTLNKSNLIPVLICKAKINQTHLHYINSIISRFKCSLNLQNFFKKTKQNKKYKTTTTIK